MQISTACCHTTFKLNQVFHENYVLVEILSRETFVLISIKESHGGVDQFEEPQYAFTVQPTLITIFKKLCTG
jgi:hypothetical protein